MAVFRTLLRHKPVAALTFCIPFLLTPFTIGNCRSSVDMDPLSIISGVTGVATACSALASTLYDFICTIRGAPQEMIDIARGIRELSVVLRELRGILKQGRHIFKNRLYMAITSSTERIADIHDKINGLLDPDGGGLARIMWAFRKSKATKLLASIESHKSTVQLIATLMMLAIEGRKHTRLVSS